MNKIGTFLLFLILTISCSSTDGNTTFIDSKGTIYEVQEGKVFICDYDRCDWFEIMNSSFVYKNSKYRLNDHGQNLDLINEKGKSLNRIGGLTEKWDSLVINFPYVLDSTITRSRVVVRDDFSIILKGKIQSDHCNEARFRDKVHRGIEKEINMISPSQFVMDTNHEEDRILFIVIKKYSREATQVYQGNYLNKYYKGLLGLILMDDGHVICR